ncbi:MAG: phenylalanine--tRNA ligase subunit beta [Nitrospinota bacterium]
MRISLRWLRECVDFALTPGGLAEALSMVGLDVEAVERLGEGLEGVVVGEVESILPHPRAERLSLCRVRDGRGVRQVVCGAPNLAVGERVALALPEAVLPGGPRVAEARIRGEVSEGMLCSESELGLGEDASGILLLPRDVPLGAPLAEALSLEDTVLDIAVTPNRPDCLAVLGVAREVAAIVGGELRSPSFSLREEGPEVESLTRVEIWDPDRCPRYAARVVRGVRVGPSPFWLQQRLRAAGMRPISNVVDITNYVMLELGQPLHAFDHARLEEGRIVVRCWRPEDGPFETLDGQRRSLTPEDLMICDARRAVAIGGVMGGANSEVTDSTRDLLLESAYFSPTTIRRTVRRLGLSSEASYRFERGADRGITVRALDRAAALLAELAGGEVARGVVDCRPKPLSPSRLSLRVGRAEALVGMRLGAETIRAHLQGLGVRVISEGDGRLEVEVPTYRPDLEREVDLIEEVARRHGYGAVPSTLPPSRVPPPSRDPGAELRRKARETLVGAGFCETIGMSFMGPRALDRLGLPEGHPLRRALPLRNPLSAEMSLMRTSLLPGLLDALVLNQNRGVSDAMLFELGRTFHPEPGRQLPREVTRLAAVGTERAAPGPWPESRQPRDFFFLKGMVETLAESLSLPAPRWQRGQEPYLDPARAAEFLWEGEWVGVAGALSEEATRAWDFRDRVHLFELDLERIAAFAKGDRRHRALARHPASYRDLSVLVGRGVASGTVEEVIREAGGELVRGVRLFDLYEGERIPSDRRSLAFSLTFRAEDRTLTDAEVEGIFRSIVESLEARLGATLRKG